MTTAQLETLREAIAMKDMSVEDMRLSCAYALQEAMQAVDYGDDKFAQERAQYVADVLKLLARR